MSQGEYETILTVMHDGFAGVHNRIDSFKDDFHDHRMKCAALFANINSEVSAQKAVEVEKEQERQRGINWGKVKTAITIAVASVVTMAAMKIIFTNIGKFQW